MLKKCNYFLRKSGSFIQWRVSPPHFPKELSNGLRRKGGGRWGRVSECLQLAQEAPRKTEKTRQSSRRTSE